MKVWIGLFGVCAALNMLAGCGVAPVSDGRGNAASLAPLTSSGTGATLSRTGAAPDVPAQAAAPADKTALLKVSSGYLSFSDPKSQSYKIGPLDVLEITVFKAPELSKVVQVTEAGTINFPLIGELQITGKSAREVEQVLAKQLGAKYLQNPQISVFVKEHNSQRVTVEGAVKKPGVVPMAGGLSLLQVLAISGGLEETAESTAVVFRVTDGKRYAVRYDVADIRSGHADDPPLQSGDVIIVPTSDIKIGLNYILKMVPLATLAPLL